MCKRQHMPSPFSSKEPAIPAMPAIQLLSTLQAFPGTQHATTAGRLLPILPTFSGCVHSRARSEGMVNIQMDHMLR